MKIIVKEKLRKILKVKEHENISGALDRNFTKIIKKMDKRRFNKENFHNKLLEAGVKEKDNLIIQASWRKFYNFEGSPNDVIDIIRDIIGQEGTIIMPSFGIDRKYFDINNTPSNAGVLSEVFRKDYASIRSACTHSAVSAQGPLAKTLVEDHINSKYGFDFHSPYYKFSKIPNSKILFLGLGNKPSKITLFHCAGYILKDQDKFLKQLLSQSYTSTLVIDDNVYKKNMVIRKKGHPNNNKVFRKIFSDIQNKKSVKIKNLDIVTMDASEGLDKALFYAKKGIYCYKK